MKDIKEIFKGFYVTKEDDKIIKAAAKKNYQTESGFLRQSAIERAKDVIGRIE